jgi:hypothetical protein
METPKLKKLVGAMYLDILTGDVHIRNQYMSTMLTHVAVSLRMEKLEPKQPAIEKFRTRLHNTVSMILHNNHPLPIADTTREDEIRKLQKYFDKFIIKIDASVTDDIGIDQIGVIEAIETLEYCRNICYVATGNYSDAMTGNKEGLTMAANSYAYIINEVTPIIYRYNMIDITESDYANAARIAAARLSKEVK